MYHEFFGLDRPPFRITPDTEFFFGGGNRGAILDALLYAVAEGEGIIKVTGEVGSGKTTLVRHMLTRTDAPVTFGFITNTHRKMNSLLPWVAHSLGIPTSARSDPDLYDDFTAFLMREYAAGRRVVLVVDEAQNLDPSGLEELRVLSNLNSDKDLLLQTILVGQPELRTTLRHPQLRQFAQRISIDYHLDKLPRPDTHAYIRHRLQVAGGSPGIFAPDAIELLYARTGGVPRLLNMLCDTALVYGFAEQVTSINAELVGQVMRDRASGGLVALNELAAGAG